MAKSFAVLGEVVFWRKNAAQASNCLTLWAQNRIEDLKYFINVKFILLLELDLINKKWNIFKVTNVVDPIQCLEPTTANPALTTTNVIQTLPPYAQQGCLFNSSFYCYDLVE